jgi:transcriptional regulator with XRE-family HTH domain
LNDPPGHAGGRLPHNFFPSGKKITERQEGGGRAGSGRRESVFFLMPRRLARGVIRIARRRGAVKGFLRPRLLPDNQSIDQLADLVRRQMPFRVVRLRDQHAFTRVALAAKAGLALSTLSQIERGVFRSIQLDTLLSLAGTFEVSLDYMAGIDHAGLVRVIARVGQNCPDCGKADAHSLPECALEMFEHGRSHAFIAARHQLTLLTVEVMLREEIRIRSVRAGRTSTW